MPACDDSVSEIKARLKERHDRWQIIHSAQGRWWAHLHPIPDDCHTHVDMVDADTPEALDAKLEALDAERVGVKA